MVDFCSVISFFMGGQMSRRVFVRTPFNFERYDLKLFHEHYGGHFLIYNIIVLINF